MTAPRSADSAPAEGSDLDLAYWAWTIIANVSQGRWEEQTAEWQEAATKWRDAFHAALDAARSDGGRAMSDVPPWTAGSVAGWLAGTLTLIVRKAAEIETAIGVPFPWLMEAREALANYDRWYVSHNAHPDAAIEAQHSDGMVTP